MKSETRRWCRVVLGLTALLVMSPGMALAQDLAAAEALFSEGRSLMAEGKLKEACGKFAASQRLDPSPGTALNLARCFQAEGRSASAWAQYLVAKRLASAQGRQNLVDEAAAQAALLKSELGYLRIRMAEPLPPGLAIRVGDTALEPSALGSDIPVDPGSQEVRVSAPDYASFVARVDIGTRGAIAELDVPALKAAASAASENPGTAAPPPQRQESPAQSAAGAQRVGPEQGRPGQAAPDHTWAYVSGGVGVAALATGVGLGFAASARHDDSVALCEGRTNNCPSAAIDASRDAVDLATLGTVFGAVGVVGLGLGATLYFFADAPPSSGNTAAARPFAVSGGASGGVWQLQFSGPLL